MAVRITQAGVALTVGIIIVTGLIIGGFFWVKNTGEQARREDAIKIAEQNLEKQSGNDVALNDGKTNGDADKNASETTPSSEDATKSDDTADKSTNTSNSTDTSSDQSVSELPQTGPADQLATLFITALLTFSVASYLSSRKQLSKGFSLGSRS